MFNHGTITAMLFLIVGVLYDRTHTRGLNEFGGLMNKMPRYAAVMTIAFFAALGLPGLSGFISEVFSLLGAFRTFQTLTIIAAVTIVLTAGYMLWVLQRVFLGTLPEKWNSLTDMNGRETLMLVSLAVIVIFLGIYPAPVLDLMSTSLNHWPVFCRIPVYERHDGSALIHGCSTPPRSRAADTGGRAHRHAAGGADRRSHLPAQHRGGRRPRGVGLIVTGGFVLGQTGVHAAIFSGMLAVDPFAWFFKLLILLSASW